MRTLALELGANLLSVTGGTAVRYAEKKNGTIAVGDWVIFQPENYPSYTATRGSNVSLVKVDERGLEMLLELTEPTLVAGRTPRKKHPQALFQVSGQRREPRAA